MADPAAAGAGLARFALTGRVALVTGSTRGIGLALARGLAGAGAHVVLNGRGAGAVAAAVAQLAAEGLPVSGAAFDVTDGAGAAAAVARLEAEAGPLAILVNNAGIQRRGPLETIGEADWRAVIETNLTGVHLVSQAVAPGMIARRGGKIVNITSLASETTRPGIGPYTAAKGGLKMLTRSMAVEWARHNIQVNAIGPGYIATDLNRDLRADPAFDGWVRGRTPAGRWGSVEEIVGAAIFLASPAADFITGQTIYVDGGLLAAQ